MTSKRVSLDLPRDISETGAMRDRFLIRLSRLLPRENIINRGEAIADYAFSSMRLDPVGERSGLGS